jgi:flagellar motor protein MotB
LSTQDRSILQAVTDVFGQIGGRVRVIGHSSMGARTFNSAQREAVNFKMSLKRANAVANELIRQGIPPEYVEVVAEGDRAPVYAETSQTGAAHNRRTEIFIDYLERS